MRQWPVSAGTNAQVYRTGLLCAQVIDSLARHTMGCPSIAFQAIPSHFSLSSNTYRIYRNRAFDRLGIEFLNQLFALMRAPVQRVDAC